MQHLQLLFSAWLIIITVRILIVEDERRIATTLKKGLVQEHFAVDLAFTGSEGLDLATNENYDLIILDLMLPEIDGIEICRRVRKQGVMVPILMLTAKGQVSDTVTGLNAGADDYLTKPFAFEELLARIKALTRRPVELQNSVLTFEDLSLDSHRYLVHRDRQQIQLSHKEFMLLDYLMRHPRTILTKQQIIDHAWDYDSNILPNTIEVYIKNLRRKIDQPFSDKPPLIQTIRGFGYRLGS